jgi:hypothetical protein
MTALAWALVGVVCVVVAIGIVIVWRVSRRRIADAPEAYAEGYFVGTGLGVGLGIGIGLGALLGILLRNPSLGLALGPAIGVAGGMALGVAWERRNQDILRPLDEVERHTRTVALIIGAGILVLGVGVLLSIVGSRQYGG